MAGNVRTSASDDLQSVAPAQPQVSTRERGGGYGVRYAILAALVLACISVSSLSLDVVRALQHLKQAPRDNINWSILQLQTEFLRMRAELDKLKLAESATTRDFSQAFDIFYSRVQTLKTAPILEPVRNRRAFSDRLDRIQKLLDEMVVVIDGGPVEIRKSLYDLTQAMNRERQIIQDLVVSSVADFAEIRDRERERLTMLIAALAWVGIVVFISLLVAVLVLRRHSERLQHRSRELAASEARLAATVGSALDAIMVTDEHGTIIDLNAQASACFGYERADAIGKPMAELIVPERMRDAHAAGMERFRRSREAKIIGKRIEIDALHADGHEFPIELAIGVANLGDSMLFVAYARDISRRRNDEAALLEAKDQAYAANHAKSRFLAVMSHEMRTPLNGILGVLQLLRETQMDQAQRALVETANTSGEVLLDLINDVLDLSKMQAGKFELDPQVFNLRELPESVCQIMASDAALRGNTIEVSFPNDLNPFVLGDAKRLRQVLLNLVSNANKFTSDGYIRVATEALEQTEERLKVRISVTDTGIGIPQDRIGSLFTDFTTLDNSYGRSQSGTGLGLSISKRIMDLFAGEIHVESELGKGSRFWIELELGVEDNVELAGSTATVEPIEAPRHPERGLRILLAEDNATNAMVARAMLRGAGHDVDVVDDGQAAISRVAEFEYDLVFMDISMPGMDGIEATRHLRAMAAPVGDIPIVALTAHTQPEHQAEILAAGMNAVLTKPIRKHAILTAAQRYARPVGHAASMGSTDDRLKRRQAVDGVLNADVLIQLCRDLGPDLAPRLIAQFAEDVRTTGARLDASRMDLSGLKSAAHQLAGCAATVGAEALSAKARALEAACDQGAPDDIQPLLDEIAALQVRTLAALTSRADELVATAAAS
jgi:PAS domain S-box-containing protein